MRSEDSFPFGRLIGHNAGAKLNLTGRSARALLTALRRSQSALIKFSRVRISWRRINRISPCARFIAARPRKWSALTWLGFGSPIDLNVVVSPSSGMHGVAHVCVHARCHARLHACLHARCATESRGVHRAEYLFDDYLRRPSVLFSSTELSCEQIRKKFAIPPGETLISRDFQFSFYHWCEIPFQLPH